MAVFPFLLVLILSTTCHANEFSKKDKNKIERGLQAGKGIADFLAANELSTFMNGIFKQAAPFLGMVGPFVGFIMSFIPAKNYQVELMKKIMKQIDNKFDQLDHRLDDIIRRIDWVDDKVRLDRIEQNVYALKSRFTLIYDAPDNVTLHRMKHVYIANYDDVFNLAADKLYNYIMDPDGLPKAILRRTKYNRKETNVFLIQVSNVLLQAIQLELAYNSLQYETEYVNHMTEVWQRKFNEIGREIERTDRECIVQYQTQLNLDVDEYQVKHNYENHDSFARGLYDHVSTKYYWRDWLVLAYDPIWGFDEHCILQCGGTVRLRDANNKRNFMISSKDKTSRRMDVQGAEKNIKNLKLWHYFLIMRRADYMWWDLWNNSDQSVCSITVTRWHDVKQNVQYYHGGGRTCYGKRVTNHGMSFEIVMFG